MKTRILSLTLALALMMTLTLAACSGNTTPPASSTPTPSPTQNETPTPPPPSDNGSDPGTPLDNPDTIPDTGPNPDDFNLSSFSGDGSEAGMTVIRGFTIRFNGIQEDMSWDNLSDFELEKDGVRIAFDRSDFGDVIKKDVTDDSQTIFTISFNEPIYEIATYTMHFKHNGIQRKSIQPRTLVPGYVPPAPSPAAATPPAATTPPPATTPPANTSNVVVYSSPQVAELANDSGGQIKTKSNNYLVLFNCKGSAHDDYDEHIYDELLSFDEKGNLIYRTYKRTFDDDEQAKKWYDTDLKRSRILDVSISGNVLYTVVEISTILTKKERLEYISNNNIKYVDSMPDFK